MNNFYKSSIFVLTCVIICIGVMTHSSLLRAQEKFEDRTHKAFKNNFSNADWSRFGASFNKQNIPISASAAVTFEEIFSDPAGDATAESAPDVISVEAQVTTTHVTFRVFLVEEVNRDSAAVLISLDTDQDKFTGFSPVTGIGGLIDIGAEWDITAAVLPFLESQAGALFILDNADRSSFSSIIENAVSVDSNMIEFTFPLSDIGGDDGNMDVGGLAFHTDFEGNIRTWDVIPNTGHGTLTCCTEAVAVDDEAARKPQTFALNQNYPNPFNPETVISFSIPKTEEVSLVVYNLIGEEVARLIDESKHSGNYTVEWNASNVASGIYFYRLQAGDFVLTRKMVLLK